MRLPYPTIVPIFVNSSYSRSWPVAWTFRKDSFCQKCWKLGLFLVDELKNEGWYCMYHPLVYCFVSWIISKWSPSRSSNWPFGTSNSLSRFTIITSCPCGRCKSRTKLPFSSIVDVTYRSFNDEPLSSGISTPKSDTSLSKGSESFKYCAIDVMVVPWTSNDSIVMKKTMLNIV